MMLFFCTIVGLFLAALPNVLWLIGWVIGKMLDYIFLTDGLGGRHCCLWFRSIC